MHEELLTEEDEFPRCPKCRERSSHYTEMVLLKPPGELRPLRPVFIHGECLP